MTFHILKSQMGWHFPHGTPYCFKMLEVSIYWTTNCESSSKPASSSLSSHPSLFSLLLLGQPVSTRLAPWLRSPHGESHTLGSLICFLVTVKFLSKSLSKHGLSASSGLGCVLDTCQSVGSTGKSLGSASSHFPWHLSFSAASSPPLPQQATIILPPRWFLTGLPPLVSYDAFHLHSLMESSFWNENLTITHLTLLKTAQRLSRHPLSPTPLLLRQILNSLTWLHDRPFSTSPATLVTHAFTDLFNYSMSSGGTPSGSGTVLGAGDPAG